MQSKVSQSELKLNESKAGAGIKATSERWPETTRGCPGLGEKTSAAAAAVEASGQAAKPPDGAARLS